MATQAEGQHTGKNNAAHRERERERERERDIQTDRDRDREKILLAVYMRGRHALHKRLPTSVKGTRTVALTPCQSSLNSAASAAFFATCSVRSAIFPAYSVILPVALETCMHHEPKAMPGQMVRQVVDGQKAYGRGGCQCLPKHLLMSCG